MAGDPKKEGTYHYVHPPSANRLNDYEAAIMAVGSILADYDSDGRVPTWGFGARRSAAGKVQHVFLCGDREEVEGVQGVLDAYRGMFKSALHMSCPTDFTEVVSAAARYAQEQLVSFATMPLVIEKSASSLPDLRHPEGGRRGR